MRVTLSLIERSENNGSSIAGTRRTTPIEWRKNTVVAAAGVIPVYAERMHMAARGLCQREARVGPMQVVIDVKRLVRDCPAPNALGRLIQNAGDRERKFHPDLFELDGPSLDPGEGADQRCEPLHRTARRAGENRGQGIPLLGLRPLIYDQAHGPVTL